MKMQKKEKNEKQGGIQINFDDPHLTKWNEIEKNRSHFILSH